ncbi:MAG TPA: MFS transporter [Vibrio sp.]|uniref:MFS transporter n=1 Tax=Vibrio TaxID=662 RepID=UPI000EE29398|nr:MULTISPECIES: MFS transporter [Vibrio]HCH00526.1 MFS transporter [Vibrio sp.]
MKSTQFLKDWALLSPASRVLVFNAFSFNLGFYMLLPYLAQHLQDLGYSSWYVGLIIGLRVLSQQGLFLVGGTLGDKFGYKRLILIGCLVRIAGFLLLAVSNDFSLIVFGAFLTGFAGALFTPSSQAYLSIEYPDYAERNRVFALQNLCTEIGKLTGPVIGLALFTISFSAVGYCSAFLFSILFILQWYYLPKEQQHVQETAPQAFWVEWLMMLKHRAFMRFVLAASVFQILFHQLYLSIPNEVKVQTGDPSYTTLVFLTSSILGVLLQLPISRWIEKHLGIAKGMGYGMAIMGCSFLALSVHIEGYPAFSFILCASLLSIGSMMVYPLIGAHIPRYAESKNIASYYGLYSCIGGFFAFIGNWGAGWLLGLNGFSSIWLWAVFALLGIFSGLSLFNQVKHTPTATVATAELK